MSRFCFVQFFASAVLRTRSSLQTKSAFFFCGVLFMAFKSLHRFDRRAAATKRVINGAISSCPCTFHSQNANELSLLLITRSINTSPPREKKDLRT